MPQGHPAPQGQMKQPTFEQFKSAMQPVIDETLPAMQQTRECVSKSTSIEETEKCMKTMSDVAESLRQKTGSHVIPSAKETSGKAPAGFEWNEENKAKILKNMDHSITYSTSMQECLKSSTSNEEMSQCMRGKMPAPAQHP